MVDLAHLVDLCAEKLQFDVRYEPGQLTGAVALRPLEGLSDQELWTLTNRALVAQGFTTIQLPGTETVTVVKLDEASSLARLEIGDLSKAKAGYVKVLHGLRYASPTDVLPTLTQVMSGAGGLALALGKTNSILLADLRPNLEQAFRLLELLDAAPSETVTEIPLTNVEPDDLVSLIESLALARASINGLQLEGKLLPSQTGQAVLLIAPLEERELWLDMIALMDQRNTRAPMDSQPVRAFLIRNRSSSELAELLNRLVGTGFLGLPESSASYESNPSASTSAQEALSVPLQPGTLPGTLETPLPATAVRAPYGRLTLSADEATNTLFATGDASLIDTVEGLIETLDVMASQVMLEVLILNLSDSDALDLGVEIRAIKDEGTIVSLSSLFGLGALVPTDLLIPSVSGFTGVVLNPGDFSVLLNALQVLNQGRALNIPKVLVNSNQKANLASVLQTPFLSTNSTTVVATTTFGGTQDAGTTIEVRPQIAEGDHLVLQYSIVLSTFVGPASDPSLPPPRQQNNLESVATIPDGYTIALGGLETVSETQGIRRVPFLGGLPVIGRLFRSESTLTSHSRFYVFIRASILRGADFQHLKFLSDVDMHRADLDPGWPEVEPALLR